jgi:peptidoglycan/LPS O-acetylase OafA/YrhL
LHGQFFTRGFLGVDMFFVLSGFLIVTLLLRERHRTGTISLRNFYARRTLRIFPIYYLLLFSAWLYYVLAKPESPPALGYFATLPFLLTYTANWAPVQAGNIGIMWSLATEEQFYLGWPLIEKLVRPFWVGLILAAVLLVNQMINFGVFDEFFITLYGSKPSLPPLLQITFTPIALGVMLAHLLNAPGTFGFLYRLLGHPSSCAVYGGLLLALVVLWPGDISGTGRLTIQLAMMLSLGTLVVRERHWARPVMTFAPLAYLGVISYGVYLYHMWVIHPIRVWYHKVGWPQDSLDFYLVAVAGSVIVAGLSYRFIEQPILALKSRFASEAPRAKTQSLWVERPALAEASVVGG